MKKLSAVVIMMTAFSSAFAEGICPPANVDAAYGPFNYEDPVAKAKRLPIVEKFHFTSEVENLIKGESGSVGGDLDYVLRSFPNHHRALNSLIRLALKQKRTQITDMHFTVDCYFERAIGFVPDDAIVHLLYGNYLYGVKKYNESLDQYLDAEKLDPQNANVLYNAGLLYFDLKDYEKALSYAKRAYAAGFPLQGLKLKLEKAGKWN
ncbi:MAG TPA: tetratricopeptide repeat protein [Burkholderiales bacterium]|nr:tetratricopeptide repeat protein [Burkholderiales bacterium]